MKTRIEGCLLLKLSRWDFAYAVTNDKAKIMTRDN